LANKIKSYKLTSHGRKIYREIIVQLADIKYLSSVLFHQVGLRPHG